MKAAVLMGGEGEKVKHVELNAITAWLGAALSGKTEGLLRWATDETSFQKCEGQVCLTRGVRMSSPHLRGSAAPPRWLFAGLGSWAAP